MADSLTTQCKRGMGNWSMSVLDKRIRTDDEASACDDDDGIYRWDAGLLYKTPRGVTVLLMNTAAKTIRYARQQFSVYDLSRIPAKGNQPFELKPAGFLRSPKSSPLVIPYASGNKMFIIPTGPRDVEPHCRLFCEVLHLAVEGNSNYSCSRDVFQPSLRSHVQFSLHKLMDFGKIWVLSAGISYLL
ncbi:hypothetical protein LINGRAHAP2_LOCUS35363 [Linum grandiflorum]